MKRSTRRLSGAVFSVGWALSSPLQSRPRGRQRSNRSVNQVLEWNQIFIDTLIATNTANSSSQRLGAIVHTAIFDAYNGIERRYTPIHVAAARLAAPPAGLPSLLPHTRHSSASSRP